MRCKETLLALVRGAGVFTIALVALSCSSSKGSPPPPQVASSTTGAGHGLPFGTSVGEPWQPLTKTASSQAYGYSQGNAVKVGNGPSSERRYLNSLRGPQGQIVQYERVGSCCPFDTKASELGGLLDVFNVTWEGLTKPVVLYLNMYDTDELFIPVGLTARQ
jgi:hypothetical protein